MTQTTGVKNSVGDPTLSPQSPDDPNVISHVSDDPTHIPPRLETQTKKTSPGTTEDSGGMIRNNVRYKVYSTSGSKHVFDGDSMRMDFSYFNTMVPISVGEITCPHAHQDTVNSFNKAKAFRRAVKSHLRKHRIRDTKVCMKNVPSNYVKIDIAYLKKEDAEWTKAQVTELYNEWSDNGKKDLGFEQEYVDAKTFSSFQSRIVHESKRICSSDDVRGNISLWPSYRPMGIMLLSNVV